MQLLRSLPPRSFGLSRSISTLLPLLAVAGINLTAKGETWTVGATPTSSDWSLGSNWTSAASAEDSPLFAPPGTSGSTYTGVRLNINGPITYSAAEGVQTYDVSAAGGENRALGIAGTGPGGHLTITGGELRLLQEGSITVGFIANGATADGTLTLNGGNLTVVDTDGDGTFTAAYGGGGKGTININSGSTMSVDRLFFSEGSASTGILNLNSGGVLETRQIRKNNGGTATLNFDGGTIRVKGAEVNGAPLIAASIDSANLLAGGLTVDTNTFTARIAKALQGAGGLTKSGDGTLILEANDSTYAGATTVNAGTLQIGNNSNTGSIGAGSLVLASGTTLAIARNDALSQSTFTGAGTAFQAGLGGNVNFSKLGSNIFTADVANTYTGTTSVNSGVLLVKNALALGSTTGATTVQTGASVALSNLTVSGEEITINFDGGPTIGGEVAIGSRGALQGASGSSTWNGNVIMGSSNSRIGVQEGASITVSGNITASAPGQTMIFRGSNAPGGMITLSGNGNSWARTEIYGYTVRIVGNNILPITAPLAVGITSEVIPRSVFDLNGFNQEVAGLTQNGSATGVIVNNGAADSVLTLNPSSDQLYLGQVTDGSKKVSLVKNGTFTQTLAGDNTYTGGTIVNAGTLQIGNNTPTGSIGTGPLTMAGGTTLAISRSDNLSQSTFTGAGASFQTGLGGGVGFTKAGNNIFTADVANSYTGATTVSDGYLLVTNAQALGAPGGANKVLAGGSLALSGGITLSGEDITIAGTGETSTTSSELVTTFRGALQSSLGDNTFTGNITVEPVTTRIGTQDGANLTLTGHITGGSAGVEFIFRGGAGSTITLSGTANDWLSDTHLYGGTLRNGTHNAVATGSTLFMGVANLPVEHTYDLNGFNQAVAGLANPAGFAGSPIITNKGTADSILTLNGTIDRSFSGVLSDGPTNKLGLVKNGSFTQTLVSTSTYTGPTTINEGTLLVRGGIGASPVTVNGGTLGGNGLTGPVTVNNTGVLAPGEGGIGLITTGELRLNSGATFSLEIETSTLSSDLVFAGGDLKLALGTSPTLALTEIGTSITLEIGTVVPFIAYSGTWDGGFFQVNGVPIADNTGVFAFGNNLYTIDYNQNNHVALVVVPEPGSAILLLGGAGALLGLRRRPHRLTR